MEKIDLIVNEIEWLSRLIKARTEGGKLDNWCWNDPIEKSEYNLNAFFDILFEIDGRNYSTIDSDLNQAERVMLVTALSVAVGSKIFEPLLELKRQTENPLSKKVGGVVNQYTEGFFPTLQTILFLSSGDDFKTHLSCMDYFLSISTLKRVLKFKSPTIHSPLVDLIIEMDEILFLSLIKWKSHDDVKKILGISNY